MAIGHMAVRTHSRTLGHTVAGALAYRHGATVRCPRTGQLHDYTHKGGVTKTGTIAAVDTPLTSTLEALAAGLEAAERRRDSRICRDVEIALPHELTPEQRVALVVLFAWVLARRYHTIVSWTIHTPEPNAAGDHRNVHVHFLLATRSLNPDGTLGAKLVQLDDPKQSRIEVKKLRALWQEHANQALIAAGRDARVNVGRNPHRDPAPTLGPARTALERKARPARAVADTALADLVSDAAPVTDAGEVLAAHSRRTRKRRRRARLGDKRVGPRARARPQALPALAPSPAAPRPEREAPTRPGTLAPTALPALDAPRAQDPVQIVRASRSMRGPTAPAVGSARQGPRPAARGRVLRRPPPRPRPLPRLENQPAPPEGSVEAIFAELGYPAPGDEPRLRRALPAWHPPPISIDDERRARGASTQIGATAQSSERAMRRVPARHRHRPVTLEELHRTRRASAGIARTSGSIRDHRNLGRIRALAMRGRVVRTPRPLPQIEEPPTPPEGSVEAIFAELGYPTPGDEPRLRRALPAWHPPPISIDDERRARGASTQIGATAQSSERAMRRVPARHRHRPVTLEELHRTRRASAGIARTSGSKRDHRNLGRIRALAMRGRVVRTPRPLPQIEEPPTPPEGSVEAIFAELGYPAPGDEPRLRRALPAWHPPPISIDDERRARGASTQIGATAQSSERAMRRVPARHRHRPVTLEELHRTRRASAGIARTSGSIRDHRNLGRIRALAVRGRVVRTPRPLPQIEEPPTPPEGSVEAIFAELGYPTPGDEPRLRRALPAWHPPPMAIDDLLHLRGSVPGARHSLAPTRSLPRVNRQDRTTPPPTPPGRPLATIRAALATARQRLRALTEQLTRVMQAAPAPRERTPAAVPQPAPTPTNLGRAIRAVARIWLTGVKSVPLRRPEREQWVIEQLAIRIGPDDDPAPPAEVQITARALVDALEEFQAKRMRIERLAPRPDLDHPPSVLSRSEWQSLLDFAAAHWDRHQWPGFVTNVEKLVRAARTRAETARQAAPAPEELTQAIPLIEGRSESRAAPRDIRGYEARVDGPRVVYRRKGAPRSAVAFTDVGARVHLFDWRSEASTLAALQLSAEKWGEFVITGNDEFKERCVRLAAQHGFQIINPELQNRIAEERARLQAQEEAAGRAHAAKLAAALREQVTPELGRASGLDQERPSPQAPTPDRTLEELADETDDVARYGEDAVRLAEEFRRLQDQHGELSLRIDPRTQHGTEFVFRLVDREGKARFSGRATTGTIAATRALAEQRPHDEIPEIKRTIEQDVALELAHIRNLTR